MADRDCNDELRLFLLVILEGVIERGGPLHPKFFKKPTWMITTLHLFTLKELVSGGRVSVTLTRR